MYHVKTRVGILLSGLLLTAFSPAVNAAWPDGGAIRRDIGDKIQLLPGVTPGSPLAFPDSGRAAAPAGAAEISVRRFALTGATLFSEARLTAEISGFTGRSLTLQELQGAAQRITDYYYKEGYLAQALVPAQDVRDGVVTIQVFEARLGKVTVTREQGVRFGSERAAGFVTSSQPAGELIRIGDLESGLLRLQGNYGIRSSALIQPGTQPSTVDVMINLERSPLITAGAGYDNYGGIFTGESRLNATLTLDSPFRLGDRLSLKGFSSSGINYGRALYTVPLGTQGVRSGLSLSWLSYELGGDFALLDATGSSYTAGGFISIPLVVNRQSNIYGYLGYDHRSFIDDIFTEKVSDKALSIGTFSLSGGWVDGLLGGGYSSAGATLTVGALDLSKVPDAKAQDNAGPGTGGSYHKLNITLARVQKLFESPFRLAMIMSGQIASKNLDSSEKFILGGPDGVRAYSTSEGAGDSGLLLTIELRRDLSPTTQLFGFYDYGTIRQYSDPWPAWKTDSGTPNIYSLNGIGIGMTCKVLDGLSVKGIVANRLRTNPVADANGKDRDGTRREPRVWFEMAYDF